MKSFVVVSGFVFYIWTLAVGKAEYDCNMCTYDWNQNKRCSSALEYINCLIRTYEILGKCQSMKLKMEEAAHFTSYNCVSDPITDTCVCEMNYYQSDMDCEAKKKALTCLFPKLTESCNVEKTNTDVINIIFGYAKSTPGCVTDTCLCEVNYYTANAFFLSEICYNLKREIHCLAKAKGEGCRPGSTRSQEATRIERLIEETDNCLKGITPTCKCCIEYVKMSATSQAQRCKAANETIKCLSEVKNISDKDCIGESSHYLKEFMKKEGKVACSSGLPKATCLPVLLRICVLLAMLLDTIL